MVKRAVLTVVLFLSAYGLFAQQYKVIDSLKNELTQADGDVRLDVLYDLAWEYRKSNPDSTLYYCREIIEILRVDSDISSLSKCYNFMGLAYHYKGDDVQSFEFYNRAIDASVEAGDSVQYAHSLNNLGRMFLYQGDFVKSYDHFQRALRTFLEIDDMDGASYAYKSLGELYQTQNRYQKALSAAKESLMLRRQARNVSGEISSLNEIALIFRNLDQYDSALRYYELAEKRTVAIKDEVNLARIYLGKSEIHRQQGEYDLALTEALQARDIKEKTGNINLSHDINLELAKIYLVKDDLEKSELFAWKVLSGSENSKDLQIDQEAYQTLATVYEREGRYEEALGAFQQYARHRANLDNSEAARMIERLEARLEIENKEKENVLLLAEKRADQAIIDRQRLQNILLTVAVLTAGFFLVMLYMVNTRRRKTNAKLREKNLHIAQQREEIKLQNDQIAQQNEKLRKRNEKLAALNNEKDTLMNILAHDLKAPFNRIHGIGHLMEMSELTDDQKTYVKLLFGASENGLNLIRDLLEVSAQQEEKSLNICEVDLKETLEGKVETFKSDAGSKDITLKLKADNGITFATDAPYLGRVLDNLISNAIKFSEPGSVVTLDGGMDGDKVYLSIADQGPGFTEEDKKLLYRKFSRLSARPTAGESSNGLGLAIVKLLVETLDGEIELKTTPGNGSTFILWFPVSVSQQVQNQD